MKSEAELYALIIRCPNMPEVDVRVQAMYWSVTDDDCELCGSHSTATVSVKCECGEVHDIVVHDS